MKTHGLWQESHVAIKESVDTETGVAEEHDGKKKHSSGPSDPMFHPWFTL